MDNTPTVVGIITARGGSKGIPGKNLVDLGGKPLIAWTIEAALQSKGLCRTIVTTDSAEIAEVSRRWGADVPFMRPEKLAQDDTPHIPVVHHVINWLELHDRERPDYIMVLQPTSPFRNSSDIDAAIELAINADAASVVSVEETHHHPFLVKRISGSGFLDDYIPDAPQPGSHSIRRQELLKAYFVNGAIYLTRREVSLEERTLLPRGTLPYIMPIERSLQIDVNWELHVARLILEESNEYAAY